MDTRKFRRLVKKAKEAGVWEFHYNLEIEKWEVEGYDDDGSVIWGTGLSIEESLEDYLSRHVR